MATNDCKTPASHLSRVSRFLLRPHLAKPFAVRRSSDLRCNPSQSGWVLNSSQRFHNPVAAYVPGIIGRKTEGAETSGLAPFWETTMHIATFNSGFRNCRTIFPYDSTLLDADRIIPHEGLHVSHLLSSPQYRERTHVADTYGAPIGRRYLFERGGFLFRCFRNVSHPRSDVVSCLRTFLPL